MQNKGVLAHIKISGTSDSEKHDSDDKKFDNWIKFLSTKTYDCNIL
jgi:hypothetical protein